MNASSTSTITEIQFLSKSDLCSALNRGFIELYHTRFIELYHFQPKNPILFSSKFLQKEIKNKRIKKKIKTRRPLEKSKKIFIEKENKKEEEIKKREETKKKYEGKQKDILKQIESYDHLKVLVNTKGVYIALYDSKKKEVSKEDDEKVILIHQILK